MTISRQPKHRRVAGTGGKKRRTVNPNGLSIDSKRLVYDDPRWRRLRKLVKEYQQGVCCVAGCGGVIAICDHIIPINAQATVAMAQPDGSMVLLGGMRSAFDVRNAQGVCRDHHDAKTNRIDAPGGNPLNYRYNLAPVESDLRPTSQRQWAYQLVQSGQSQSLVGDARFVHGERGTRLWTGDIGC